MAASSPLPPSVRPPFRCCMPVRCCFRRCCRVRLKWNGVLRSLARSLGAIISPGPTCGSRSCCCCCCICRDDTQRWFHPKMHDNLKVTVVPFSNHTGPGNNVCKTWTSRTQAGLGRIVSQEEEQISPNRHCPVHSTHYLMRSLCCDRRNLQQKRDRSCYADAYPCCLP